MGGGASQFSLVAGQPLSDVSMIDVGLYAEDEWRIRPNISLSYGLRYETQTGIPYAGRLGAAREPGLGTRALARHAEDRAARGLWNLLRPLLLQLPAAGRALQWNHAAAIHCLQSEFLSADSHAERNCPSFASLSPTSALPTVYQVQPNLHVPYTMEAAFSVERQVTKNATVSVTYLNSRGVHQLFLRNANAPLPGTYNPADPTSGVRPLRQERPTSTSTTPEACSSRTS